MNWIARAIAYIYGKSRALYYQRRYEYYRSIYQVHPSFGFNGTDIRLYGNGVVILGADSYIGSNSTICTDAYAKVMIGKKCQISHNVRIYNSSANPDQDFTIEKVKPSIVGDVIIEDGVWIGANVFINPNITIGRNTVVGANSVVTKNLEPNAIYGGVPAKLIRYKTIV
jgi:maltose O-acetyltransferase